jgi:hypothetical protein
MKNKLLIGANEWVDFPDFDIHRISAKIDTGAYTSSLHCSRIKEKDGELHFVLVHTKEDKQLNKEFLTTRYSQKRIRSSNGTSQLRYVIKTFVRIHGKKYKTEFSLTDRSRMKNPVLIGRKLLRDRFLVDVSLRYTD